MPLPGEGRASLLREQPVQRPGSRKDQVFEERVNELQVARGGGCKEMELKGRRGGSKGLT